MSRPLQPSPPPLVTQSINGLMRSVDKTKLDARLTPAVDGSNAVYGGTTAGTHLRLVGNSALSGSTGKIYFGDADINGAGELPVFYDQDAYSWDFGLSTVSISSIGGREATGTWVGSLTLQGGTSITASIAGGNIIVKGGQSTLYNGGHAYLLGGPGTGSGNTAGSAFMDGGPGASSATKGQVYIGTQSTLTSAVTIGHSAIATTVVGTQLFVPAGTSTVPGLTSSVDPNTGLVWGISADQLGVVIGGFTLMNFWATIPGAGTHGFTANAFASTHYYPGDQNGVSTSGTTRFHGGSNNCTTSISLQRLGGNTTLNGTSGLQSFIQTDTHFAPTSGTAEYRALNLAYTLNQTGGANGAMTGLYLDGTETAIVGTHTLANFLIGGTSKHRFTGVQYLGQDGTGSLPGFAFVGNAAMGMTRNANNLEFYTAGGKAFETLDAAGSAIRVPSIYTTQFIAGNFSQTDVSVGLTFLPGYGTQDWGARWSASGSYTKTSGTQEYMLFDHTIHGGGGFAPTSGTAVYRHMSLKYKINQTGGASGVVTGLYLDATETAVGSGGHRFADFCVAGVTKHRLTPTQYLAPDGTSSLPGISFAGAPQMGIWRDGNELKFYGGTNGLQLRVNDAGQGMSANRLNCFEIRVGNTAGVDESLSLGIYGGYGVQTRGFHFGVVGAQTLTSGTQTMSDFNNNGFAAGGFAPTSGTAAYRHVALNYTVNQTGGANGAIDGLYIDATATAVGGTHNLINAGLGANRYFQVSGAALADGETAILIRRDSAGTESVVRVMQGAAGSGSLANHRMLQVAD